jgi:long-chain acyl-CoA synthetase
MAEVIAKHATARADAAALIDDRGTTTWAQLDQRVNRLISALRARGVASGGTVAAMVSNRREYYEVLLAAMHTGAACVLVNWHWTGDEVAYVLENSDASVFVADAAYAGAAVVAAAANPQLAARIAIGADLDGFEPYEAVLSGSDPSEPEDQVLGGPMFYTSGTTGRPKGVRPGYVAMGLPTSVLELMAAGFGITMNVPADGVTLLDGPLYHSAQWAFSMLPLVGGSTVVIRPRFDPAETLRAIDHYGVTNVHLVPTQFVRLLRLPDEVRARFDGSSLVLVLHGAAPCPQDVKRRMIEWWGPTIVEYYGGTEGGVITMASSEQWLAKPGTLGPCLPNKEIIVVGDDNERLGPGEPGTLYLRDTTGLDFEYHKDPEKTASAHLEPGVFTLGDVGYLDDDGWLFMSDRKIDMIISGGVNIYPAEIEAVLLEHPAVRDAAVFGIPEEEFGEQVKAAVELDSGYEPSAELEADIIAFVRTKLAGYKAPRSVDFEDELPRQPTGKLYKRLLRDRYWAGTGRSI